MTESIPLTYFQDLSHDSRLVEVLTKFKSALQDSPTGLDNEGDTFIEHLISIITNQPLDNLAETTITEIGELGSHLLGKLYYESFKNGEYQQMYHFLTLAFTYWIVRNNGLIIQLDYFVTALAQTANKLHDTFSLESLYEVATFVIYTTDDGSKSKPKDSGSGNPWKILILNYGIIATRTHNPELMASAYETLLQYFPTDAPDFFQKARSEMDRLKYPQYVRVVVERFIAETL